MNLFNLDDLKNDYKNVNINVFLRCDLNITENDYSRIDLSIPTILELLELDSVKKLIICTHLGRPKNSFDPELSTKNKIKPYLEEKLRRSIIHHLFKAKELLGYRIASIHNLAFLHILMNEIKY